MLVIDLLP